MVEIGLRNKLSHKGWTWERGSPSPTRPIASGYSGMNIHLSEIVSDFCEPLADNIKGKAEVISTEDLKARLTSLNQKNENWNLRSWWVGKECQNGMFKACGMCEEVGEFIFDERSPELCSCVKKPSPELSESEWMRGDKRIRNKEEVKMITVRFLHAMRRLNWETENDWCEGDPEVRDMLCEDVQDHEPPLCVIGWDAVSLYPNMDLKGAARMVYETTMKSEITWREVVKCGAT